MSIGDVNRVDPTGGVYPSTGDLHGSSPALAAQFHANLQVARQHMTAGQRYAWNETPWQPNQTAADASRRLNFRQPSPQINKVPLPTNTPDLDRPPIKPGAGGLAIELGLIGAAFHQLGRIQQMIEHAPVLTPDGKRFDPDALKAEIMKQLPGADRQRLGLPPVTAGGTEKPDAQPQSQPPTRPGSGIETRTQEERDLVTDMQAQGKSNGEIQNALAVLRAGQSGVTNRTPFSSFHLDESRTAPLSTAERGWVDTARKTEFGLPRRTPGSKEKTVGILESEGIEMPLISGERFPPGSGDFLPAHTLQARPRGEGSGFDAVTEDHVEGHAATLMHEKGIKRARLWLDNEPCPPCDKYLERMIPKDSVLQVIHPRGAKMYEGEFFRTGRLTR